MKRAVYNGLKKMVFAFSGQLILKAGYFFEGAITTEEDREKMSDVVGERLRAMQETGQIPAN